ncbi:DUF2894 domain-containing protein [Dyella amyloliquefaciens]|uniref:DUF2894 domain-containing protein n=1 Tax=Dyella amyloliquefaciens TaxID=1770545 RepID=UPI00102EADC0|nr:DUF2894 domain-containing protein [Dyella amyloliquefaciens]
MSKPPKDARTQLDAWREAHADRLDPVRFHFIDALEKRASHQQGEVRRLLDGKLSTLIEAYTRDLKKAAKRIDKAGAPASLDERNRGALGELVDRLTLHAAERDARAVPDETTADSSEFPALATLDEFQQIWSQVRTQSQVRQSMQQAPTGAGPLNSSALVHRSIALMRELSPGYLQQFLSYVDDLAWIEQMSAAGMAPARESAPTVGGRKRSRGKAAAP